MISNLVRLIGIYRPHALILFLGVFLAIISSISSIILASTSGWFITSMGLAGVMGVSINYFTPAAIIRACAIIRTGGKYLERLITHNATLSILQSLRVWLYKRLVSVSPIDLQNLFRAGDLFNRLKTDVDILDQLYLSTLVPLCIALGNIILVAAITSFYSISLAAIITSILLVCLIIIPAGCFLLARHPEEKLVNYLGQTRADLTSHLQGIRELMILDENNAAANSWKNQIIQIKAYQNKIDRTITIGQSLILFLSHISLLISLIFLLPHFANEEIKLAILVMIMMLSWVSFEELGRIPFAIQSLPKIMRAASRIFEFDRYSPAGNQNQKEVSPDLPLSFDKVSFAYAQTSKPVLEDFTFCLPKGQSMAIVGPTGSGKTTILNLLLGFCSPDEGSITPTGTDYFSVVQQRPHLFDRTIEENLRIANPSATTEEIEQSCLISGLLDFIKSLPQGFNTYVGENGLNLSGGELKRLSLARALLKDSPYLILDEVGEGLDHDMEEDIMNRVLNFTSNKGLIVITHNRKIAEKMDLIVDLSKEYPK